jgi:hypothetical protein
LNNDIIEDVKQAMATGKTERGNIPWADDELRRSVEAYILLLRFQVQGADTRWEPLAQALLSQSLTQRNDAAIRYRMRNISAVVQELGAPVLPDFSPAESVGTVVRPKIRAMLLENAEFARILNPGNQRELNAASDARAALRILRSQIEDFERELAWRWHNGPPDHGDANAELYQLREAIDNIDVIDAELEKPHPDTQIVKSRTNKLLMFVGKLGEWLGARTTKFVDATLSAAGTVLGPIVVAKVTGLLPPLADAIEAVTKAIAN